MAHASVLVKLPIFSPQKAHLFLAAALQITVSPHRPAEV